MSSKYFINKCKSYPISIYIAGEYENIKHIAQEYCNQVGLCVTITKLEYVYTNGNEFGCKIGLINYPRFESTPEQIFRKAEQLAYLIVTNTDQESYSIETPEDTYWYNSTREQDAKAS